MHITLGIDIGKTSIRVGAFDDDLSCRKRWSTSSADVSAAQEALRQELCVLSKLHVITAVGLSIFGPLGTDIRADDYGAIHNSSDPLWSGANFPALVRSVLQVPIYFDYDVNAGALAEFAVGAARSLNNFFYLSIGTGIGGVMFRGTPTPGYAPQVGHMYVPQEQDDIGFLGTCIFHQGCLQGLASGRALVARWGIPPEEMELTHAGWDLQARYIGRACANLVYAFSPQQIVVGGSVGGASNLIERTNLYLAQFLNGFVEPEVSFAYHYEKPVIGAGLIPDSSLVGAALLASTQAGMPWKK